MATATYLKGEKTSAEYTATGAVVIDQVVVIGTAPREGSVGIAQGTATGAGVTVVMDIGGCYTFPAATGAVIKAGETVDWDVSAGKVDDNAMVAAAGDITSFGVALAPKAAAATATSVLVKLLPGNGTVSSG